jgi:hypothetical protein
VAFDNFQLNFGTFVPIPACLPEASSFVVFSLLTAMALTVSVVRAKAKALTRRAA